MMKQRRTFPNVNVDLKIKKQTPKTDFLSYFKKPVYHVSDNIFANLFYFPKCLPRLMVIKL